MSWSEQVSNPPIIKTIRDVKAPAGFTEPPSTFRIVKTKSSKNHSQRSQINDLKIKKGWEVAMAPIKSLPMTLIMNYMTGNSLQIFSISMTLMQLVNPIKAIFDLNSAFAFFQGADPKDLEDLQYDILVVKLAFIASQLLCLGLGIYKINSMGLIPNSASDWLAWESYPLFEERLVGFV